MNATDRKMMERVAAAEAVERDKALKQIEYQFEQRKASAKARYEAELSAAANARTDARNRVFLKMERAQEATENFIAAKNDREKIRASGLSLPWLHPSNDLLRAAQNSLRANPS